MKQADFLGCDEEFLPSCHPDIRGTTNQCPSIPSWTRCFFWFDAIYDGDLDGKPMINDLDVELILLTGEKKANQGVSIWFGKGNLPTHGHNLACELVMSFTQIYCVHPRKVTWQWNITIFDKRYILIPALFSIVMLVLWGVYFGSIPPPAPDAILTY